jgi:hypothetical protein
MKKAFLLLFILCFAPFALGQEEAGQKKPEDKDRKLIRSLNLDSLDLAIPVRDAQVQEEVSVEAEEYPGLNISVESPANSMRNYKPFTKQELQAYSDLLVDYSLADYDRSETARPHKPSRLFRTTVPD